MKIHAQFLNIRLAASLSALALASVTMSAHAATITNGTFQSTGGSSEFGTRYGGNIVAGYSTSGYNFVYLHGATTAAGEYGNVSMPSSVLTNEPTGNYIALDANFDTGAVSTTVTGLSTTATNYISFYYDTTAQVGFTGGPISLAVSLGSVTDTIAAPGPSTWTLETLAFNATSSTETLSFLANATSGAPPFALIADVTSPTPSVTPEPSSLALLSTGLFGVAGFVRSRFKNKQ